MCYSMLLCMSRFLVNCGSNGPPGCSHGLEIRGGGGVYNRGFKRQWFGGQGKVFCGGSILWELVFPCDRYGGKLGLIFS